jgi:hypothetical protein
VRHAYKQRAVTLRLFCKKVMLSYSGKVNCEILATMEGPAKKSARSAAGNSLDGKLYILHYRSELSKKSV